MKQASARTFTAVARPAVTQVQGDTGCGSAGYSFYRPGTRLADPAADGEWQVPVEQSAVVGTGHLSGTTDRLHLQPKSGAVNPAGRTRGLHTVRREAGVRDHLAWRRCATRRREKSEESAMRFPLT